MEQVILEITSRHIKKMVMGNSQNGFMKGKSGVIDLKLFYDEMTNLVDEGRAVNAVYLVFNNAFDTQNILRDKLMMYGLNKWTGSTVGLQEL